MIALWLGRAEALANVLGSPARLGRPLRRWVGLRARSPGIRCVARERQAFERQRPVETGFDERRVALRRSFCGRVRFRPVLDAARSGRARDVRGRQIVLKTRVVGLRFDGGFEVLDGLVEIADREIRRAERRIGGGRILAAHRLFDLCRRDFQFR